jgi:hypothetical protein
MTGVKRPREREREGNLPQSTQRTLSLSLNLSELRVLSGKKDLFWVFRKLPLAIQKILNII